jgi:hypothetical protein
MRAYDDDLLGSWASVTADLVTFCGSKGLSVYSKISDALGSMADPPPPFGGLHDSFSLPAIVAMMAISTMDRAYLETISKEEIDFTTSRIKGERTVEMPDRYMPLEAHTRPEPIVLSDLKTPADYATAPC